MAMNAELRTALDKRAARPGGAPRRSPGKAPTKAAYRPKAYVPRTYKKPAKKYSSKSKTYKQYAPQESKSMWSPPESFGASVGGWLGHGIQGVVKALTGFGDYKVRGNSLMGGPLGGNPPIMKNSRSNGIIVRHREYLADVFASTAFSVTTYPINPGLISTFPWLQQQADSFEQYKFRGLVFEFKTMSSDAVLSTSASSALGTVIMSSQYNVLDQPFTDKRTMENYEYANSTKPSLSMYHPIECKMSQTTVSELYVRNGAVTQGDLRLYDLCNFNIAVQGMQNAAANQVIGEIWCTYEIEFFKPKLLIGGGALLSDHYYGSGVNVYSTPNPFGVAGTAGDILPRSGNTLGTSLQIPVAPPYGSNSIVFPQYVVDGTYLITYIVTGTGATPSNPQWLAAGTTVNVDVTSSNVLILQGNTSSYSQAPQPFFNGNNQFSVQQIVRIIQTSPGIPPGIQWGFAAGNFPTGSQSCELIITQLNPKFN